MECFNISEHGKGVKESEEYLQCRRDTKYTGKRCGWWAQEETAQKKKAKRNLSSSFNTSATLVGVSHFGTLSTSTSTSSMVIHADTLSTSTTASSEVSHTPTFTRIQVN